MHEARKPSDNIKTPGHGKNTLIYGAVSTAYDLQECTESVDFLIPKARRKELRTLIRTPEKPEIQSWSETTTTRNLR